eukprot:CAMPEP_0198108092 /NCGR_PEP_ID=MMETSP1442-20131203/180_1 /TAXON_ID= /ORGANISM="Craspedostauros australis, Strain CCMP3328" /LENGTH=218 /DNA_ID=CAMNT_0043763293 /DNA_START=144 /DNA_END=800 /DNA_ORIENTATION=-
MTSTGLQPSIFAMNENWSLDGWDEGDSELLVDHKGEDSHHGGTALVELDGALLVLGLLVEGGPAVVDESVTEVTHELSSGDVLHDEDLEESDEGEELEEAGSWDGAEGAESGWDIRELGSVQGDGSWETDSGLLDEVSDDGEHGDTSVLDLDETEALEVGLVAIGDKAEWVEESEWSLGTELLLEGLDGGGASDLLGWGESSGGGDEGGEDAGLHGGN